MERAGEGVIVAHGGSAIGYSLYIKDDSVVFATRQGNDTISRVAAPVSKGDSLSIRAGLSKDGVLSLAVNEGETVNAKSPGLLKNHPQEDLSIGHDDRNPVDPESPTKPFKGLLMSLKIAVE